MISEGMARMSYYIVMAFVAAHFVALFNRSNLGLILAISGAVGLAQLALPAPILVTAIVVLAPSINLVIGSASAKWGMLAPVLVFCQRWVPGFGMGSLIAAMLPYYLAFLDLPVGPDAPVEFVLPK